MSTESRISTLDSSRAYTDAILRSEVGRDLMAVTNAEYEMITNVAAPGASVRMFPGHIHDSGGSGRGIMRGVCGRFYCVDTGSLCPPTSATLLATDIKSAAVDNSSLYVASGDNYIMGVAYVSPGIANIRVETCWAVDDLGDTPEFRIKNITDNTTTEWCPLDSLTPKWYYAALLVDPTDDDVSVTRTATTRPRQRRIDLDIEIRPHFLGMTDTTFLLYCAFPYEFEDAAS